MSREFTLPTSHINRLPVELLCPIFRLAANNDYNRKSSLDTSLCPWTLTGVCRRWRTISIETQDLWADIRFTFDPAMLPHRSNYGRSIWEIDMELIKLQLKRSDRLSVDIYLNSIRWMNFPYLNVLSAALRDHYRRWRSFTLWDSEDTAVDSVFRSLRQATLPHLERLEINSYSRQRHPWNTDVNFFTLDCPRLRHITFEHSVPFLAAIPWSQIEELTLGDTSNAEKLVLSLAVLGNLRKLNLKGTKLSSTLNKGQTTLPRLEVLDITYINPADSLNLITTPALHTINFHDLSSRGTSASPLAPLRQLIHRSHCTILSLLIKPVPDLVLLFNQLDQMPELKHLEIRLSSVGFLEQNATGYERSRSFPMMMKARLSDRGGQFRYCPRLAKLVLDNVGGLGEAGLYDVLSMAEERGRMGTEDGLGRNGGLEEIVLNGVISTLRPGRLLPGDASGSRFFHQVKQLRQLGMLVEVNFMSYYY